MPTLQFKGKTFVQNHHLAVPYHQLVPDTKKSKTNKVSLNDNLIVHGDNLLALKALLPTYAGQVKCIYIDPPYNTGNEGWVYNDNVKSPLIKEWIGKVVGKEEEDLVRHDKWLCMMMPRLKLLRDLLHEEGVIFISIDDNEESHLKILMDEIFMPANFLGKLPRRTKIGGGSAASDFAIEHDYVIVYAKNKEKSPRLFIPHDPEYAKRYKEEDEYGKFFWDTMERSSTATKPYEIIAPDGTVLNGKWFRAEETFKSDLEKGEVKFLHKKDGSWSVQFKQRPGKGRKIRSLIENEFKSDQAEYEEFGISKHFDYPKPVSLIKELIQSSTENNDIILDSFAGSGTTAQAVLELNKEDGKNRKFILVECEDYADDITAERVRRVINGVPSSKNELVKNGLGGSFSYFDLGEAIEMESLLSGKSLPKYEELARYLFYTATGEEFKPEQVEESSNYIGSTQEFDVYSYYKPDLGYLKTTALTLDEARLLRSKAGNKPLLVFAPTKYVEQQTLDELKITFCQLPFEIYRMKK